MIFDGDTVRAKGPAKQSYEVDLQKIYRLEARQNEISGVGLLGARELMKAMEDGMKQAGEALVLARLQLDRAEQQVEYRQGVVYMEVVPQILKVQQMASTRSPSGSEDQRKSLLAMDTEYRDLQDYCFQLKAIVRLLENKWSGFKNSYFTVQRVFDEKAHGIVLDPVSSPTSISPSGGGAAHPVGVVSVDGGPYQHQTGSQSGSYSTIQGIQIGKPRL